MDTKPEDKIAAFDTLYTNNHIQMLKILIPTVGRDFRHKLAVYIKYMEFQYTLSLANSAPHTFGLSAESERGEFDFTSLCDELFPYCGEKEQNMLKQLKNMQSMLKQYKELEAAMAMMKELFPDMGDTNQSAFSDAGSPFSMEMLMQLLSPEQQNLFSMFQNKKEG